MRQSLLAVLAVALLMAFSGCLGNLSPKAEANLVDTLTGSDEDEPAEESPAEPVAEPAAEPETDVAADVLESEPPVVVSAPEPIAPRRNYVLPKGTDTAVPTMQARPAMDLTFASQPASTAIGAPVQWPVEEPEEVPVLPPIDPIAIDIDVAIACHYCTDATGAAGSAGFTAGEQGIDAAWIVLPPGAAGLPYEVSSNAALGDPDGEFLASCAPDAALIAPSYAVGTESGVVPAGASCLVMWEYAGPGGTISFRVG